MAFLILSTGINGGLQAPAFPWGPLGSVGQAAGRQSWRQSCPGVGRELDGAGVLTSLSDRQAWEDQGLTPGPAGRLGASLS